MKSLGYWLVSLVLVLGILLSACAAPSGPQPAPAPEKPAVERPALSSPSLIEEQQLVEGAKREGQIVWWFSTLNNPEQLLRPFKERYPFLEVKMWDANGQEIINKMMEESKAGRYSVDIIQIPTTYFPLASMKDLFLLYEWPNVKNWPDQPAHGYYANIAVTVYGTTYNTMLLSAAEAPKSWEELNSTKWRGKAITSVSSNGVALAFAYFWGEGGKLNWEKSLNFWTEVIRNTRPMVQRGFTGSNELHAAGETALFIMNSAGRALSYVWKGAPVEIARVPKVHSDPRSLAIALNAPHPNAAKLLANYLTSLEGQVSYSKATVAPVLSPEAANKARGNLEFTTRGIEIVAIPIEFYTEQNLKKANDFWLEALGKK